MKMSKMKNSPLLIISLWGLILSIILIVSFFELYSLINIDTINQDKHFITIGIGIIVISVFAIAFFFGIRPTMLKLLTEKKLLLSHANTDPLTGLYNRRAFLVAFDREINLQKRGTASDASLVLMDLDDFKLINDTFGHDIGDDVLRGVSITLKSSIRSTDVVARIGGEEFILLLPNTSVDSAYVLCEKIRICIRDNSSQFCPNSSLTITTLSMGIINLSINDDFQAHLSKVDKILYKAKNAGKDCIIIE